MSFKAKIAAGAATFALAGGGLGTVGTLSASAATPSCGHHCWDLYTQKFGPRFLLDTFQRTAAAGQQVILYQASNSDPAEDFVIKHLGTVHEFYAHHRRLIAPGFDRAFGRLQAYELQYEPLGVNSGFCVSTWPGVIAQPGYKVRLEPCGEYANSIWAAAATPPPPPSSPPPTPTETATPTESATPSESATPTETATPTTLAAPVHHMASRAGATPRVAHPSPGYTYLINGATDRFSNPLVLNYPAGYPTDLPRPWLNVQPLNTYADGTVFDNQQWRAVPGPVHGGM